MCFPVFCFPLKKIIASCNPEYAYNLALKAERNCRNSSIDGNIGLDIENLWRQATFSRNEQMKAQAYFKLGRLKIVKSDCLVSKYRKEIDRNIYEKRSGESRNYQRGIIEEGRRHLEKAAGLKYEPLSREAPKQGGDMLNEHRIDELHRHADFVIEELGLKDQQEEGYQRELGYQEEPVTNGRKEAVRLLQEIAFDKRR